MDFFVPRIVDEIVPRIISQERVQNGEADRERARSPDHGRRGEVTKLVRRSRCRTVSRSRLRI